MAAEEDKKFDAVLGGYLNNDLRARAGRLHCPEPDMLAAYHERSLSLDELNSWKQHIAGCSRCQQILAQLEATDQVEADVAAEENILVMSPPALSQKPSSAGEELRVSSGAATPAKTLRPTSVSQPRPSVRSQRKTHWTWLAPAGAIAASLLVWVAIHESKPAAISQSKSVEMADNRQPSPTPLALPQVTPPAVTRAQQNKIELPSGKADSANRRVAAEASKHLSESGDKSAALSKSASADAFTKDAENAKQLVGGMAGAQNESKAIGGAVPKKKESDKRLTAAEPMPSQPAFLERQDSSVSPPVNESAGAPPPPAAPAPAAKAPADTASGAAESVEIAARARSAATLRYALVGSSQTFGVPGRKSFWRLGSGGLIEHSDDSGATWVLQPSTVTADLSAGVAVSEKVCWVVGKSGAVLRTTDGGAHWYKLNSPVSDDLIGVRATDAFRAWVWADSNQQKPSRRTYRTTDGGATWTELPEE